mmetsp:Transcript_27943/g.61547  ORF Transcript_27943/g.61547 Transcript_27943/m.61547 type:complete len:220 (-) Transcript_27943:387-1046(-)
MVLLLPRVAAARPTKPRAAATRAGGARNRPRPTVNLFSEKRVDCPKQSLPIARRVRQRRMELAGYLASKLGMTGHCPPDITKVITVCLGNLKRILRLEPTRTIREYSTTAGKSAIRTRLMERRNRLTRNIGWESKANKMLSTTVTTKMQTKAKTETLPKSLRMERETRPRCATDASSAGSPRQTMFVRISNPWCAILGSWYIQPLMHLLPPNLANWPRL